MVTLHTDSGVFWKLFRFCRANRGNSEKRESFTKRLFSRSEAEKQSPAEPDFRGDPGISVPWQVEVSKPCFNLS